jgi:hypothetical protein
VVTNPPFLSKARAENKSIFENYQTNNLYKCFLISLINSNSLGGVLILPANFWLSDENRKLRKRFLLRFCVHRINIFEEQIFCNARVTVCSFDFSLKKYLKRDTDVIIFPRRDHFIVNLSSGDLVDLKDPFINANSIKVAKSTTRVGKKLFPTALVLQTFDSSEKRKISMFLSNQTTNLSISQIPISVNRRLCYQKQLIVARKFNSVLYSLRKKYSSLIFSYFLSCKYSGFKRKKISTKFAYQALNHIISNIDDSNRH